MNDSEFLEKCRSLSFNVKTIGKKVNHHDVVAVTGRDSELGEIARNKTMFKAITQGNASDPGLKRDVQEIVEGRAKKADWRPAARERIEKRKEIHRAKWGKDSIS